MKQLLTEKQHEEVRDIMDNMSCKLDFACYKISIENICRAEYNEHSLVCKISSMPSDKEILFLNCEYRLYLGNAHNYYVCRCPLRIYIAKNLKR